VNQSWSSSAVVLDFGGQNSSNTGTRFITNDGTGATYGQVAAYAEQFGKGYYDCAHAKGDHTTKVFLALGTNNSASQVSSTGGSKWATAVVQPARSWISSHGYASQVFIWGGNDLETGYSDPTAARAWVTGFTKYGYDYIDYGDAGACSWTSYQNAACYVGAFHWKQADVYAVAWGNPYAFTYPEIYKAPG